MSHTLPDYTTKYKLAKIFGNVDNAELAARLGGPSTMDRRGNFIWYDDFEAAAALKWTFGADGAGTAALSSTRAWMGNQSMKTVTGALAGNYVTILKAFCLPVERRMATECMFYIADGKPIVSMNLTGWNGTTRFEAQVKFDSNTGKLYYYDETTAWVEIPRYDYYESYNEHWNYMKLVIDWDREEYIRFIFGSTEYYLTGIPIYPFASLTKRNIRVFLMNEAATAEAATVYFDNFILTQNEP
jgi:hypothetical protein